MSNEFDVKVVISTAQANANLKTLDTTVGQVDKSLREMEKSLKATQGDLTKTAAALNQIVASQKRAAQGTKELAAAQIAKARADGVSQQNVDRHRESVERQANTNARTAKTTQQIIHANQRKAASDLKAAAATKRHSDEALELEDNLSNSRYLLYDVGATYRAISIGLLAIPAATAAVSAAHEQDFAQVIRTTGLAGAASEKLQHQLKNLAAEIPVSFGELSQIATIAGQLGIAETAIGDFTETTAKFLASTDVSLEESTALFGRLANSFDPNNEVPDFFNKIGSAIAFTGVNAVATETEIAALLNQIAPLAANAGFAADESIALASALASVRVRPELARGTLTRIFGDLNNLVLNGGPALTAYAEALGYTEEETRNLIANDTNKFFTELIASMSKMDKLTQTKFMGDIGLDAVRDQDALIKLSGGYDVLRRAQQDTAKAFEDGTFLNESTEVVFATLISNLKELVAAFGNLAESIGGDTVKRLADITSGITDLVQGASNMIDTVPGLSLVVNSLLALGTVVGVLLALKSAQAFVVAGLIGFQQVAGKDGIRAAMSLRGTLELLKNTLLQLSGVSKVSAASMATNNGAMGTFQKRAQMATVSSISGASGMAKMGAAARVAGTGVMRAGSSLAAFAGGPVGIAVTALSVLAWNLLDTKQKAEAAGQAISTAFEQGENAGLKAIADQLKEIELGFGDGTNAIGNYGKNITELADKYDINFRTIIGAVSGGKEAVKAFNDQLDRAAQERNLGDSFADIENKFLAGSDAMDRNALEFLKNTVSDLRAETDKSTASTKAADQALGELGVEAENTIPAIEKETMSIEDFRKALEDVIGLVFSLTNAQGALGESMRSLGAGLAEGGTSLNPWDEAGANNLSNLQSTLTDAALLYNQFYERGQLTAEKAAAEYAKYIDGLVGELTRMGVPPEQIRQIAQQAKNAFESQMKLAPPTEFDIRATDKTGSIQAVKARLAEIKARYGTLNADVLIRETGSDVVAQEVANLRSQLRAYEQSNPTANVNADTRSANNNVKNSQKFLNNVFGRTYTAPITADTSAANENVDHASKYAYSLFGGTVYTAPINADTNPAVAAIRNLVNFALEAAEVISNALGFGKESVARSSSAVIPFQGSAVAPSTPTAPPMIARPTVQPARGGGSSRNVSQPAFEMPSFEIPAGPPLAPLTQGYNEAAEAARDAGGASDKLGDSADKAGKKGKKAGKDTADGMDDAKEATMSAAEAVDDYAQRLGEGLDKAYQKQYGLQEATDAYHSQLNSIKKAREDELKQIEDLIQRQKELRNEREAELVTARKAQIEQKISQKYGETDRAADYGNQAQTALDNAAAKQKEIDASKKEQSEIQAGIGNLKGYSDAAIANRAAVRGLEKSMLDMIEAYAATGASQSQVRKYTESLTSKFNGQVAQLGFNRESVRKLTGGTDRYIGVVNRIPERVATDADNNFDKGTNKAGTLTGATNKIPKRTFTDAGNNFGPAIRGARDLRDAINGIPNNKNINVDIRGELVKRTGNTASGGRTIYDVYDNGVPTGASLFNRGGQVKGFASGGLVPGESPSNPREDNMLASVDGQGLIGIRSREFIQPEPAVDYYGLDFMEKIRTMKLPKFYMGGSPSGARGSSNGGISVVELTAENLQAILKMADRPVNLYADSEQIANSANKGNAVLASKGMN